MNKLIFVKDLGKGMDRIGTIQILKKKTNTPQPRDTQQ